MISASLLFSRDIPSLLLLSLLLSGDQGSASLRVVSGPSALVQRISTPLSDDPHIAFLVMHTCFPPLDVLAHLDTYQAFSESLPLSGDQLFPSSVGTECMSLCPVISKFFLLW